MTFCKRMMNSFQHHQSWRLNIQSKAKNFNFKLSATTLFRHCNCTFFQFSLKLKLFTLLLITLKSKPKISNPTNPRSPKSRLRRFLEKIRIRSRPKSSPYSCAQRELFSGSSVAGLGGIVGLLSRSVFKKGKDGIFMLGSTTLLCFTWLFKNFLRRNLWVFMVLMIAAVLGFSGIMDFWNHFNEDYATIQQFWKVKKLFF